MPRESNLSKHSNVRRIMANRARERAKFIRKALADQKFSARRKKLQVSEAEKEKQQLKKGGRGWLHI